MSSKQIIGRMPRIKEFTEEMLKSKMCSYDACVANRKRDADKIARVKEIIRICLVACLDEFGCAVVKDEHMEELVAKIYNGAEKADDGSKNHHIHYMLKLLGKNVVGATPKNSKHRKKIVKMIKYIIHEEVVKDRINDIKVATSQPKTNDKLMSESLSVIKSCIMVALDRLSGWHDVSGVLTDEHLNAMATATFTESADRMASDEDLSKYGHIYDLIGVVSRTTNIKLSDELKTILKNDIANHLGILDKESANGRKEANIKFIERYAKDYLSLRDKSELIDEFMTQLIQNNPLSEISGMVGDDVVLLINSFLDKLDVKNDLKSRSDNNTDSAKVIVSLSEMLGVVGDDVVNEIPYHEIRNVSIERIRVHGHLRSAKDIDNIINKLLILKADISEK